MLDPLTRPRHHYEWAMQRLAFVEGLTNEEVSVVLHLHSAAEKSLEDFDAMRHIATQGRFAVVLASIITKAREQGIGAKWEC